MGNASFLGDFSCLLLRHFPTHVHNHASSWGKYAPLDFQQLLLMSKEENVEPTVFHSLNILDIFFPHRGKMLIELSPTALVNTVGRYLQYLSSNVLTPGISTGLVLGNLKSSCLARRDCTGIVRALIGSDNDLAYGLESSLGLKGTLDAIVNEEIDFYKLLSHITTGPRDLKYSMPLSSFLVNAYSDSLSMDLSDVDDSYFVALEWPDLCSIFLKRFALIFQKEAKSDMDAYQLVSAIVALFEVNDVYSIILLYYLRIAYVLKHPNESDRLSLIKKIPSPINRLLEDELLFASANSYQASFLFMLMTIQFGSLSPYQEFLASMLNLSFDLMSSADFSRDVAVCLLIYGFIERRSPMDHFSLSKEGLMLFSTFQNTLNNAENAAHIRRAILQPESTLSFRRILDLFSPSFGLSIDRIGHEELIEAICRLFCTHFAESYYHNGRVKLHEIILEPFGMGFSHFALEEKGGLIESQIFLFLVSEAICYAHEFMNIQMFLLLISSVVQPPLSELRLISPFLNLLNDIIAKVRGKPKAVPKILFFYQVFSSSYQRLLSEELEDKYKIECAKTLGVLEYINVEIPPCLQSMVNMDRCNKYIYDVKRSIKIAIQDLELSCYDCKWNDHLDPIPVDICDAWLDLLRENKLHSSQDKEMMSHLFDHHIDKLLNEMPSLRDYKYYLLNCEK